MDQAASDEVTALRRALQQSEAEKQALQAGRTQLFVAWTQFEQTLKQKHGREVEELRQQLGGMEMDLRLVNQELQGVAQKKAEETVLVTALKKSVATTLDENQELQGEIERLNDVLAQQKAGEAARRDDAVAEQQAGAEDTTKLESDRFYAVYVKAHWAIMARGKRNAKQGTATCRAECVQKIEELEISKDKASQVPRKRWIPQKTGSDDGMSTDSDNSSKDDGPRVKKQKLMKALEPLLKLAQG